MKKNIKLYNVAKRTIATVTLCSVCLAGVGIADSFGANGASRGNGTISEEADFGGYYLDGVIVAENLNFGRNSVSGGEGIVKVVKGGKGVVDVTLETTDDVLKDASIFGNEGYGSYLELKRWNDTDFTTNVLGTVNFSQAGWDTSYSTLKNRGGKTYVTYDGACSEVAMTILAEYYNYKNVAKISDSDSRYCSHWEYYFGKFMDIARAKGVYPMERKMVKESGLETLVVSGTNSNFACVLSAFYKDKDIKLRGNYYRSKEEKKKDFKKDMREKVVSRLDLNNPVIGQFAVPNGGAHSMVIVGIYRVVRLNNIKNYYVVNDGWKNCESGNHRIQYIDEKYLNSIVYVTAYK